MTCAVVTPRFEIVNGRAFGITRVPPIRLEVSMSGHKKRKTIKPKSRKEIYAVVR